MLFLDKLPIGSYVMIQIMNESAKDDSKLGQRIDADTNNAATKAKEINPRYYDLCRPETDRSSSRKMQVSARKESN
jgi:hypothetical protein